MDALDWTALLRDWTMTPGPKHARLAGTLQAAIRDGFLASGEALPSERALASLLGVSRSTVVVAYDALADAGWLTRRQGSGTSVSESAPRAAAPVVPLRSPLPYAHAAPPTSEEIDLTIAVPPLTDAHRARLRRASEGAFEESLYHPLGLPDLRALLAEHYTHGGLPTAPEQIVVTSGAQQAIVLVAGVLLQRGDHAALESPTYFGAIDAFRAAGARLLGLPITARGVEAAALHRLMLTGAPRLAFLTPTFQNPTGSVMPLTERQRVADLVAGADLPLIEDDTLIDLSFDRSPPPRIANFAPTARILNVGSLSKLFWAGLRVGWVRAPRSVLAAVQQAKTLADFGTALPSQAIALRLLDDLPAIRAERRAAVLAARDEMTALLRHHLPQWTFEVPGGGQFLWVRLPGDAGAFSRFARPFGVRLFPGAAMHLHDAPDAWLRLPFTVPPELLEEAVTRLARAWHAFEDREAHVPATRFMNERGEAVAPPLP